MKVCLLTLCGFSFTDFVSVWCENITYLQTSVVSAVPLSKSEQTLPAVQILNAVLYFNFIVYNPAISFFISLLLVLVFI